MRSILEERAVNSQCISYVDLADVLGVTKAPIIATVTDVLENLIDEDVSMNKPLLSALVIQKGWRKLPRPGFFEKLNSLNIININSETFDEAAWHINELNKLKKFYTK